MAMKPEFQQEANWDPALTALPILEAPGFRVDSWRFEPATFPFYAFDPGAMRVLEILRESGVIRCAFYLFIRQPHGSEVSPAARNTLDSARIPRASKLLICGLFQKGRVLAQDGVKSTLRFVLSLLVENHPHCALFHLR